MVSAGYAAALEAALPAGGATWRIIEHDGWLQVVPEAAVVPNQGWKLHVSGAGPTANAVLAAVLPILVAHRAVFKLAANRRSLEVLNSGAGGLSQVGKLVSVYPADPQQAVALAALLHTATVGIRGPRIPSDRPLVPESLVHYRYGGFDGDGMTITAPDGTLVPDPRSHQYEPPAWVQDPFLAAGIASDHVPGPRRVYAGRYVVLCPVYRSPANTVMRALDVQARRRCVLKEALPGSWLLDDGRDARDYLRHEHSVLSALAPVADVPAPLDLLELDDGATVLVRELVLGPTLAEAAAALRDRLGGLPMRNVVVWCAQLAEALLAVHAAGWVLRDLKPQNVVLSGGRLWLIDVGCAAPAGADPPLPGAGTRGYVSAAAIQGGRAVPADDVFSLGAVLLGLATGADPAFAPDADDLLERNPSLVRPDASVAILDLAASCLAAEPSDRPELVDVAARLHALASATRLSRRPPAIGEERHEPDGLATLRDQRLRDRVTARLVAAAEHAPDDPFLDRGRAGLVLALASLLSCGSHAARAALSAQADALAAGSDRVVTGGLAAGHAGVAVALAQAGVALGRRDLAEAGAALLEREDIPPHRELFLGSAGIVRACVIIDEISGNSRLSSVAELHGRRLLDELEPIAAGHGWAPDDPVLLGPALGYGHGAAGIADALLDLHAVAPDAAVLEAAAGVVRLLAGEAIPGCVSGSLDWPETVDGVRSRPAICHGAAGITRFLAHARRWEVPGAATLLPRAALSTARGTRTLGPNVCHGLAGGIEALLDIGEARWHREASSLASLLYAFRVEWREGFTGWQGDVPGHEDLSFMRGTAGVAATLCRIAGAPPALLPRRREASRFREG